MNSNLDSIDGDLARLREDFQALQANVSALPDYPTDQLPTKAEVAAARSEAQTAVAEIDKAGRGDRSKGERDARDGSRLRGARLRRVGVLGAVS